MIVKLDKKCDQLRGRLLSKDTMVAKRIWMLEGNWGDLGNLCQWCDDVVKDTPGERIDAEITTTTIHRRDWPMIADDAMIPAGLLELTKEQFRAWTTAIAKISRGDVADGEINTAELASAIG